MITLIMEVSTNIFLLSQNILGKNSSTVKEFRIFIYLLHQ